ncbi:MAG: serine/threonine protein kinase [Phycisphaeraceae bacterium]|nr:serine/threonine protein kinase [Phycisphaeraceae bacterium]
MPTSEPARWAALRSAFAEVADLPPEARQERLAAIRANNTGFADELERLLAADLKAEASDPVTHQLDLALRDFADELSFAHDERTPPWIGDYRIEGTLGAGGMGVVYLAEQQSPKRTVALKVIRGASGASAVRRFHREGELLGRLQHPNIALIHEAGLAREHEGDDVVRGPLRPYFAMELVRGEPIAEHVRRNDLDARVRVALMVKVCDAIDHAHSRGVIHRDLKSANILVDEHGEPKVLDFGIARALDRDHAATVETAAGEVIGTLPYMSPEQVSGQGREVGVHSDVYALGVVLFEVLTGRRPIDLAGRSLPEAVRLITDAEPTRLGSIDRSLRGDLETIVDRCLEKEPARRYPSAGAVAADLRRHLAHEPILARPASTLYQVAKFARRHRPLVIGLAAAFVALIAATVTSITFAVRTTRALKETEEARSEAVASKLAAQESERLAIEARKDAERSRDDLKSQLHYSQVENNRSIHSFAFLRDLLTAADPTMGGRPDLTVRELVQVAAEALQGNAGEDGQVKGMVGQLIATTLARLGDVEGADRAFQRSIELLAMPDPNTMGRDHQLFGALTEYASFLHRRGRLDEAEAALGRVIEERMQSLLSGAPTQRPGDGTIPSDYYRSVAQNNLALISLDRRDYAEAEARARHAHELELELVKAGHRRGRAAAISLATAATAVHHQGRVDEAIALMREAISMAEAADGPDSPTSLRLRGTLTPWLTRAGRFGDAVELMRGTRLAATAAAKQWPGGEDEAWVNLQLAQALALHGNTLEALAMSHEAFEHSSRTERPTTVLIRTLMVRGSCRALVGDAAGAEADLSQTETLVAELMGADHEDMADVLVFRSFAARCAGDLGASRNEALRAMDLFKATPGAARTQSIAAQREAAFALASDPDPQVALRGAEECAVLVEELATLYQPRHPIIGRSLVHRAEALLTAGRREAAAEVASKAADILADPSGLVEWWSLYATLLSTIAQDPAIATSAEWPARLTRLREAIIEVAGPTSVELSRLDRLVPRPPSAPRTATPLAAP